MQRGIPVIIALIAIGILILGAFFVFQSYPEYVATHTPISQVATSTMQEETAGYKIHVAYPQFGVISIDDKIRKNIEDAVTEFKSLPQNPHDSSTLQNTFDGLFDDVYVGPDIVSARLILSQYTGGAHPSTLFSGVNYDKETGKLLLLDDALKLIGKSVAEVSEASSAQFKTKLGDAFFAEGANTNPENFSSFVISKSAVTFILQQYQVAAYAEGPQEMVFPRVK